MGDFYIHVLHVAFLHEDVPHVARAGLVAQALLGQTGMGIGGAGVGLVAAFLPF